jgi:hypothetical protein
MTTDDQPPQPDAVQRLAELQARLGLDQLDSFDELSGAIYWPDLPANEAKAEWEALRTWVDRFRARFPRATKIPDCWFHHGDLVEALSALRDYERASFSSTAPPTAAIEWHRAFRDMESRYEAWIKRLPCGADPRRGHEPIAVSAEIPDCWEDVVSRDVALRARSQLANALG